jgi:hypothetical protein
LKTRFLRIYRVETYFFRIFCMTHARCAFSHTFLRRPLTRRYRHADWGDRLGRFLLVDSYFFQFFPMTHARCAFCHTFCAGHPRADMDMPSGGIDWGDFYESNPHFFDFFCRRMREIRGRMRYLPHIFSDIWRATPYRQKLVPLVISIALEVSLRDLQTHWRLWSKTLRNHTLRMGLCFF